jgi:GH15 family glucan-1,4-alpha-glucosidase
MYAGLQLSDPRLTSTAKAVEEKILNVTPSGGVLRYENDNYFRTKSQYSGNPWIVSSLWLAQYYASVKRDKEAMDLLSWALDREVQSGALGEQFDPETGKSVGILPLVWSHAEMVNTILDLSKIQPSA